MEYGELMLSWHKDWPKLFENILWSDEVVFHIGGFVNWDTVHNPAQKMAAANQNVWHYSRGGEIFPLYLL
jgi:hypothetical protein